MDLICAETCLTYLWCCNQHPAKTADVGCGVFAPWMSASPTLR